MSRVYFFVFQDAVADHIFELLLEFLCVHAHSIAFPEVALPAVVRVSSGLCFYTRQILSKTFDNLTTVFVFFVVVKKVYQDHKCSEISQANEAAYWEGTAYAFDKLMMMIYYLLGAN